MFQCIFFSFSWLLLFLFVCLFLFFFKRFIILQLSCGNYEAVACKISLSDRAYCYCLSSRPTVIFCDFSSIIMHLGNGVSRCHCDTLAMYFLLNLWA
jgi:hypothetical protein